MNFVLLFLTLKTILCSDTSINYSSEALKSAKNEYIQLNNEFQELFFNLEYLKDEIEIAIKNVQCITDVEAFKNNLENLDKDCIEYNQKMEIANENIERRREILRDYLEIHLDNFKDISIAWLNDHDKLRDIESYIDSLFESFNYEANPIAYNIIF